MRDDEKTRPETLELLGAAGGLVSVLVVVVKVIVRMDDSSSR